MLGVGRGAALGMHHCIDPSDLALDVARKRLGGRTNVAFSLAGSDTIPLADGGQDFGYSLGVLHHIPDTQAAMKNCVDKLKAGAPFLAYLYYSIDNRSPWFGGLWRASNSLLKVISRLPFGLRNLVTGGVAAGTYWPLARVAGAGEKAPFHIAWLPLSFYRHSSFSTMRTDTLNRFITRLKHRFSHPEIETMMKGSGLTDIHFREDEPYWVACGCKA